MVTMTAASVDNTGFRYRNDDGNETGASWIYAVDTNGDLNTDTTYRMRIELTETAGGTDSAVSCTWEYNNTTQTTGWVAITTTSSHIRAVTSANFTEGDDTTQQLGGGGTFISNNNSMTQDGVGGSFNIAANELSETELSFQIRSVDVNDNDSIQLRVTVSGIGGSMSYTTIPTITVNEPALITGVTEALALAGQAGSVVPGGATIAGVHDNLLMSGLAGSVVLEFLTDQTHFRFRNDDGSESAATWYAAEDANVTLKTGRTYRVRFQIDEYGGGQNLDTDTRLQYNLNGAGWNNVFLSSSVVLAVSSTYYTDGDPTTAQLTASAGGFIAGNMSENGTAGGNIDFTGGEYTEVEFAFQIIAADVAHNDSIQLRMTIIPGVVLDVYSASPIITVDKNETIAGVTGAMALAGQAATVTPGTATITGVTGGVSIAGHAATVSSSAGAITIVGAAGALAMAAHTATVTPGTATISGVVGALSLAGQTGSAANLVAIPATVGAMVMGGQSASVTPGAVTVAGVAGVLSLAGQSASPVPGGVSISATTSAMLVAGQSAIASTGAVTIAGVSANLVMAGQVATPIPGGVSITGVTSALTMSGETGGVSSAFVIGGVVGAMALAGQSATPLGGGVSITGVTGNLAIAGQPATIEAPTVILATDGAMALAGQAGSLVTSGISISANTGILTLAGYGFLVDTLIDTSQYTVTVSPYPQYTVTKSPLLLYTVDVQPFGYTAQVRTIPIGELGMITGMQIAKEFTIRNDKGNLSDPTTFTFYVQKAGEASATAYVYLTDSEITRESLGVYRAIIPITSAGTYRWMYDAVFPTWTSRDNGIEHFEPVPITLP